MNIGQAIDREIRILESRIAGLRYLYRRLRGECPAMLGIEADVAFVSHSRIVLRGERGLASAVASALEMGTQDVHFKAEDKRYKSFVFTPDRPTALRIEVDYLIGGRHETKESPNRARDGRDL